MDACNRLQNELIKFNTNRSFGCYARPLKRDIMQWQCQIYYDGFFIELSMIFPKTYPLNPPTVIFKRKLFHPNVYTTSHVCLDILGHKWVPSMTINDVLSGLVQLLRYPNTASPANTKASDLYRSNRGAYEEKFLKCLRESHCTYTHCRGAASGDS
ncbi:ubiquitin-conjugating enzyme E2 A [Pancytospora philotis]|nr:ubiquitin-conjugating enzyme E2 A [Pancytospora philotis]